MSRISVLIRTRNEARHLGAVLDAVLAQSPGPDEIAVLDSGSQDATCRIASERAPRVRLATLEGPFSYGRALNCGIAMLQGDVIVSLSAHSLPCDRNWLRALTEPLEDARVAASYGRQIPYPDCYPWEALAIARAYGAAPRLQDADPFFSNTNAAIRRSVWDRVRFDEQLPYAEDRKFAMEAQRQGHWIAYAPEAAVLHSHNDSLRRVRERAELETAALSAIGCLRWPGIALVTAAAILSAARCYASMLRDGGARSGSLWGPALYEIARLRGQHRGARSRSC